MADEFFHGVDQVVEALNLGSTGARLDDLVRLSRELISALDVEQALIAAGEAVRQVCDGQRFVVLLDVGKGQLQARAARDGDGADLATPTQICSEACEAALAAGDIVFAHLPLTQSRWANVQSVQALNLVGFTAVPMLATEGGRGVIYVDGQSRFVQRLDAAAREMLLLLGTHAAMAVGNAQMLEKVQKDSAGELQNRVFFERRLSDELLRSTRYQRPFSIVYIDIDNAEALIMRYDLAAVDELIAAVAGIVRSVSRDSDFLARVGPARLGLLLPEQEGKLGEVELLRSMAGRLREQLRDADLRVREVPLKVTVTIGAVTYQQPPLLGLKGVLHEADLAIDVAKRERSDHFIAR